MYYADNFYKEFRDEVAFHEYLDEVEGRADWFRVPAKKLTVLEASANNLHCTAVEGANMEDILADTRLNTNLCLKFNDQVYPLGITAIGTIKGRARINGSALSEVPTEVLANILNECLKVSKGDALLRLFEGKIRAVLSGDKKDYAVIPMPELFMVGSAYINDYRDNEFIYGYADHYSATLTWKIADNKLTEVYRELLKEHGKELKGYLFAFVRITTSDVGASGANIFYSLMTGQQTLILGEAMKIRHMGSRGIEDFSNNMENIFECYKQRLKDLGKLYDIPVKYPANVMIQIMDRQGFSKKLIAETVEHFKKVFGEEPCTAYEVYCGICETVFFTKSNGGNIKAVMQIEEKIARCMSMRWREYDIPGDIKY